MKISRILVAAIFALTGCHKPSYSKLYASGGEWSYRVDEYEGSGAAAPSSAAVFAVFKTAKGTSEQVILDGIYVEVKSVSWVAENEANLCITGGYTDTYRRVVVLSVGAETKALTTHLHDDC